VSDILLTLGSVVFRDFEVPAGINLGGKHRLAIHRLPGGTRVIDALGRDDAQITFTGIFSGTDATLRARALDEMRSSGQPLPLTWDVFFYTVLISEFQADYRNGWWIPYRIACTVLRDEAAVSYLPAISLVASISSDVGMAISLASNGDLDLSALQATIDEPQATTRGADSYSAALQGLQGARESLNSSIALTSTAITNFGATAPETAQDAVSGLLETTDSAGQLSMLTASSFYLQRAATNLTNASS
jgi:hypothetical protein